MIRKILYPAFILFFTCLCTVSSALAQDSKKIAVFPFEVFSQKDAKRIQQAFLSDLIFKIDKLKNLSVIDKNAVLKAADKHAVDEDFAFKTAADLSADYAVIGNVSEFGDTISVDAKLLDVKNKKIISDITEQGQGVESIPKIAESIKIALTLKVFSNQKIVRIEYRGNRKIESNAVNQVMKTTVGSIFSEADLSNDIKAIYKMGYFNDVSAEVTDTPEGKVITFYFDEKGLITDISFQGNKALDKKDLENVSTIKTKQILNQEKIKADIEKMKALYDSKGYYNAEISYNIEKEGAKDVRVIFQINEQKKIFIRQIGFEGNKSYTDKELKKLMTTVVKGLFSFFTESGVLKRDVLKQDMGKINAFYLNNGFVNAQVGEPKIAFDKNGIYITVPITEGKRYRIGQVSIAGDELKTSRADLLQKIRSSKKEYYDREAVIKDMEYLTEVCNDEGYAYAEISPQTAVQEQHQTVDVTYQISKGEKIHFGRITITGNTKTRDKVIRRQLEVVEGELFSRSNLKKSYMALNRLRYFEEVDFQTEKGRDNTTDINIRVKEKQTGVFSIGAGYSAIEHAVLTAQVTQQNLFGRGQSLSLRGNVSTISTNYELSFTEPWLFDIPLWSSFSLWDAAREYDTYNLDSKGFGLTFGYPLFEYVTGYMGYKWALDDVKDINEVLASSYVKQQQGETKSSILSASIVRDTTDDIIFPSRGSKNSASVEYTGSILGGDTSYTKYNISSAWFFPLPFDTVFGIKGRAGHLEGHEGKEVPVYERFYLGGINTLRGLRNVGPVDPATGDFIGGLTMINFNVEFVFPLLKDAGMRGVVFFDTGNTWEQGYHFDDMRMTAGAGVRWYSPIGPFRLEWGRVLDRRSGESASRWEFTIGMFM